MSLREIGPSAQPTSAAWPSTEQGKSTLTLLLACLSKLGAARVTTKALLPAVPAGGLQAGLMAHWPQPWENKAWARGQKSICHSGPEIPIPITLTFSLKKSSLNRDREARLPRLKVY